MTFASVALAVKIQLMNCDPNSRFVSVEDVVSSKFYGGKKAPRLLVWLMKKILHEKELNELIAACPGEGDVFCQQILDYLNIKIEVKGLDNVPADGTVYTFASNHPLGGVDGMTLCSIVGSHFGPVRMLVNDFLMFLTPLRPISIPINKVGSQVRNLHLLVNEVFESKNQIFIFPAGLCSRKIDGKVQDLAWSKTFVQKSIANNRFIVPVHFIGQNSKRFYWLANTSKRLGLKFNIAMVFLVDELFRAKGKTFKIIFGKPIPPEFFDKSKSALEWASWMRTTVYNL